MDDYFSSNCPRGKKEEGQQKKNNEQHFGHAAVVTTGKPATTYQPIPSSAVSYSSDNAIFVDSDRENSDDLQIITDDSSEEESDLFVPQNGNLEELPSSPESSPAPYYGRYARARELPMDLLLQSSSSDDEEEIKKFNNYAEYSTSKYSKFYQRIYAVEKQRDKQAARRIRMSRGRGRGSGEGRRAAADDDNDHAYGAGAIAWT